MVVRLGGREETYWEIVLPRLYTLDSLCVFADEWGPKAKLLENVLDRLLNLHVVCKSLLVTSSRNMMDACVTFYDLDRDHGCARQAIEIRITFLL